MAFNLNMNERGRMALDILKFGIIKMLAKYLESGTTKSKQLDDELMTFRQHFRKSNEFREIYKLALDAGISPEKFQSFMTATLEVAIVEVKKSRLGQ